MIEFTLPFSGQTIIFASTVVAYLQQHRQLRFWNREAGGQLFAQFESNSVVVSTATGPRGTDRRGWRYFVPDRDAELDEITEMHRSGLHFVGDWHTHAEDIPNPSQLDLASISDCVRRSQHQLNGFLLVLVGRLDPPDGLHVSFHNGESYVVLPSQK